ncbi:MAG: DUF2608 domain-containing protein [Chlamydiales bacterium]|nr:DUF2608 domain-containing protein [Chlamydiales bacterium]
MPSIFLSFCLFLATLLQAELIETFHFQEIQKHLCSDTLILLDIDDTLLIPVQMLGCDEWFESRLEYHRNQGLNKSDSLEKSLAEWEAVRHLTKMRVVEPGSETLISDLQQQNYKVMGFTTQGLALAARTSQQLNEAGIDLTRSAPSCRDIYLIVGEQGVLFRNGILFTSGTHKGEALFSFLDRIGYMPKHIIFINDKASHLRPVEEAAQERGVEFIGLRYAYSDPKKAAFDKQIASYQFIPFRKNKF